MINGNDMWGSTPFPPLHTTEISGKTVLSFADAPKSAYHAFLDSEKAFSRKTAIVDDEGEPYTYSQLLGHVDTFAAYLYTQQKIHPGTRVALLFSSNIEFCISFLALSKLAAVAVLLPSKYKQPELLSLAARTNATCILCDQHFQDYFTVLQNQGVAVLASAPAPGRSHGYANLTATHLEPIGACGTSGSDAMILFTSGTTEKSKIVLLKNYNIMHAATAYKYLLHITSGDKTAISIPIYTITGTVALLILFLSVGGTLYLHKKFDANRILQCMADEGLTFFHASPTAFALLLDQRSAHPNLPHLRRFACGSSNMPVEHIRKLKQWIPQADFHTVYGLTETSSPATIFPCGAADSEFIGSSGLPIPGVELMIADDAGQEVPTGTIGEIFLRGTVVIDCYLSGGEDAFTPDGWFKSGDLGYVNKQGYLYVVDRKKDIINRGGEKICSFDVENALHNLPGIAEAALVGIPHPLYGEQPVAVVRMERGAVLSEADIKDALSQILPKYMIPTKIQFAATILKTPNGKIDKKGLRDQFQQWEALSC